MLLQFRVLRNILLLQYRLPCENKIVNADISDKQGDDGCHGDDTSSDQFNTNRNSNVLCYQPLSQCDDKGDKTSTNCVVVLTLITSSIAVVDVLSTD